MKLRTARLKNSPLREYAVTVHGPDDEIVCWCGPYSMSEWRDCIHLFSKAGWHEVRPTYRYNRIDAEPDGSNGKSINAIR